VTNEAPVHKPVLMREALDALIVDRGGCYVDCTFGRGGHSRKILERLDGAGRLLALDRDIQAVESDAARELLLDERFVLRHMCWSQLREAVRGCGWSGQVCGVLLDLGVSSPQLEQPERGFSFLRNGPLDMRMDTTQGVTAAEWLAKVSQADLLRTLRVFGEEKFASRVTRAILQRRSKAPIETTGELAALVERAVPIREKGKHPATRTFQAIRIAINDELGELEQGLRQAVGELVPGGRLVVIAFHSLEDRLVKRFMRNQEKPATTGSRACPLPPAEAPRLRRLGKAAMPSQEEVANNPRARSAVLRVAERLPE
jgi:16S rRNA (cytosine1402-N4)-methyltransferase